MPCTNGRISEVYAQLCSIMRNPQDFGLSETIPEPLHNALARVLCTLSQIEREKVFDDKGDLEIELSQDADQPSSQCSAENCGLTLVKAQ